MEEFKIYSVSDKYISFLRENFPNLYSNKIDNKTHTRKYVGVVVTIEDFKYYIPIATAYLPMANKYRKSGCTPHIIVDESYNSFLRAL